MFPIIAQISDFIIIKTITVVSIIGLLLSSYIFIRLTAKNRLRLQFILDIFPKLVISGIIWGRAVHVITNYQFYFFDFSFSTVYKSIAFWGDKELAFWGVVLGIILSFIKHANKRQENISKWSDIFAISFLSFMSFVNLGAFFEGINYGKPTDSFLGINFLDNINIRYTTAIHPTQLYAVAYCSIIALVLYTIHKKYRHQIDGLIFYIGTFLFSIFKFIEGFFRGDDTTVILFQKVRVPELIFLIIGIISFKQIIAYQKRHQTKLLKPLEKLSKKIFKI